MLIELRFWPGRKVAKLWPRVGPNALDFPALHRFPHRDRGNQCSQLPGGPAEPGYDHRRAALDHPAWWECGRGDPELVKRRQALLGAVSLFPVNERILELARLLTAPGAVPEKAGPDAVHIAAAAIEQCEYLLTWNFRHIANARIRLEVERILAKHAYKGTTICTPEELV